jgi:hypothetical protein
MLLLVVNFVALLLLIVLLVSVAIERRGVNRFARAHVAEARDPWRRAHALAGAIHACVARRDDDPLFLSTALAPIGAAPMTVVRDGGCCSGISRLYILALDAIDVSAAQVTLYHKDGHAQHCLVEVTVNETRQVIDPTYGFAFETHDGRPMSLDALQAGNVPRFVPLPQSSATSYPRNEYYAFNYAATKTANWTRSWQRRLAYHALSAWRVISVDRLRVPAALEWPHLILAAGIAAIIVSVNCVAAFM